MPKFRSVATAEVSDARAPGDVGQPAVSVALKHWNIPVELDAKAGGRLSGGVLSVSVHHLQVQPLRQRAKPGSVVLDRMADEDAEPPGVAARGGAVRAGRGGVDRYAL